MPLPWKKSKIGRVSRFVSDLKSSSSKHGGSSLVVETGFPTSLVDLMIKNRDLLKKPSKKNKKLFVDSSDSVNPPPPPPSLNSPMLMVPASPSSIKTLIRNHISSSSSCNDDEIIPTTTQPRKKTFLFMFKLLLILSLGFGTKKIALLITITAFVLMLVEICGKSLISILKPCQDVKDNLNTVVESVLNSVQPKLKLDDETDFLKNDSSLIEQKEILVDEDLGLIQVENGIIENVNSAKSESGALIISENEANTKEENEANTKEEIQIELGFDSVRCGCRWGFSESDQKKKLVMKDDLELIEDSNAKGLKKKTSVKFNSKMLKKCFVPMLRGSKKNKKKKIIKGGYLDSRSEFLSTSVNEDDERLKNRLDQENEDDVGDEQEAEEEEEEEEDDELEDEVTSRDFSQIELEAELKPIDVRTRITATWNSLVISLHVIIILIGLIGGRFIALVATIIWCLMLTLKTRIATKNQ